MCGIPVSSSGVKLKTGQTLTFMKQDSVGLQRAKVLGRAKPLENIKTGSICNILNMMAVMGKRSHVLIIFTCTN